MSITEKVVALNKRLESYSFVSKTPCYIYDELEVKTNLSNFKNSFSVNGVDVSVFYAVKSNFYSGVLKTIVESGDGLDVSSQRELKLAIEAGAKKIMYTGPAKTEDDFKLILDHYEKITVNLESPRELELLAKMAEEKKVVVRCGLRIVTKSQKGWTKFGQPFDELKSFFDKAITYPSIKFCGIHFHISMNKTPQPYVTTLTELAEYITKNFSEEERARFEYIDMGGGYYPRSFEGIYPWNPDQEIKFFDNKNIFESIYKDDFKPRYVFAEVAPIEEFGKEISETYLSKIKPLLPNVVLYTEPGRFISHSSMHILLKIVEMKDERPGIRIGITDGGGNIIGWEKYQFCNYSPIFNLTSFDPENEIPFILYGSLCTPDDIWGYYLHTREAPKVGDIILMPFQGAYTYTLAQSFIKDIPEVYDLV